MAYSNPPHLGVSAYGWLNNAENSVGSARDRKPACARLVMACRDDLVLSNSAVH